MKTNKLTLLAGIVLASLAGAKVEGQTLILSDNYNVTGSGTGFALNKGVNAGINPPAATRLSGQLVPGVALRYYKYTGDKADSAHSITGNLFSIAKAANSATITLGPGSGAFDFSSALHTLNASPEEPSVYEFTITMGNASAASQRCSFGLSSDLGTVATWDFGLQIYRPNTAEDFYTIQKRIDAAASGLGADLDEPIATTANGTWTNGVVSFLVRVTDAGMETSGYHSRVQVSTDGGVSWIYDTASDTNLLNGFRLDTAGRYFFWDAAGNSVATYDDFSLKWISGPAASLTQVWTGGGADAQWSTTANWESGMAPASGDRLIFKGSARQVNANNLEGLTLPSITFSNGGFQLGGNALALSSAVTNLAGTNTLGLGTSWATASTKNWYVAPGSELVLGGASLVDVNGNHTLYGGGTWRLTSSFQVGSASTANPAIIINEGQFILDGAGASFTSRGGLRIGSAAATTNLAQMVLANGAYFSLNTPGGGLRVGDSANAVTNRLVVEDSTLAMSGGTLGVPWVAKATGEVNQLGGTVRGCILSFNESGAGNGTYTVRNGTLEPLQITNATPSGAAAIYFDNAILRTALGVKSAFFEGVPVAEIRSGGLTLDISQADVVLSTAFSGPGTLTKVGSYTATLTGANTHGGSTRVQGGKLVLSTVQTNAGALEVADGAELGVALTAPGTTLAAGSLSLGTGSGCSLSFDLGTLANPTAPLMQVGSLSTRGAVTVNLRGGSPLMNPGTITLIRYTGVIGGSGFTALVQGTLPAGMEAHLVNNPGSLDLVITAVQAFRWTGAQSADWDTTTPNWISSLNSQPGAYSDGFRAEFLDGATRGSVTLQGVLSPAAVVVSNSALAYAFHGGTITSPMLRKEGTNTLTRLEGYDQMRELELNAGAFILNNGYDASFDSTLTDTSAGLGSFIKQGLGTLTVNSNSSTFDGAILIREGVFKLGGSGALGSTNGSTTVANGASLDVNNIQAPHEPVFVSGAGVGGQGAIFNSSTTGGVQNNLTDVTMTGNTVFGSASRWDIRVRNATGPGPGLRGNGYNLTKVGAGTLAIASQRMLGEATPYWELNLGDILISEGTIALEEAVSLGNPEKSLTLASGTGMNLFNLGLTNPIVRHLTLTDASVTCGGQANHTNILTGSVLMSGQISLRPNNANLIVNGPMSGTASVSIGANPNPGIVVLNGTNTYTGDTTVTNSILAGNGSIAGSLVMTGGGLAPGMGVGTFTVGGNAALAGTNTMELAPGQVPNSDRLNVGGMLTGGGALVVTFAPGAAAPRGGTVFQLFNKGVSGFASITLPDLSTYPGGLVWETNSLAVDGSIRVRTTLPPGIGTVTVSGGTFTLSGTGGNEGATYRVVTSPDVAAPLANWTPVATNVFGPGGSFSFSTHIGGSGPGAFFRLQVP